MNAQGEEGAYCGNAWLQGTVDTLNVQFNRIPKVQKKVLFEKECYVKYILSGTFYMYPLKWDKP
jgi:hypothetical protein